MGQLTLRFLGAPEVYYAGQLLKFPTKKALALLIYLSVAGGRHQREKLMALFWPESDVRHAQASLRNALARLRTALGTAESCLQIEGEWLCLATDAGVDLDLGVVVAALERQQPASLQAAANLRRGEFLEGFSLPDAPAFDEWASFQREHWHWQMSLVLERLSQLQAERGDVEAGLDTAMRWVAHDPLNEAAHRRLMQMHFIAGNKAAALQAYEACLAILAEELDVEPAPETEALAERIRTAKEEGKGLKAEERYAPSSFIMQPEVAHPSSMPVVGRSREHSQLVAAYHHARNGRTRIVSLEGEAGIGKTHLARHFLQWATAQGATLLQGRAFETGGHLPYQPVVDAIRPALSSTAGMQGNKAVLSVTWLAELSRLLPELHDLYPRLPTPAQDETAARLRLFEAIARLGQALAEQYQPVVFFMDDLHWADAASLAVLRYCCRAWAVNHSPILLLLALRSEALATTPTLNEWLTNLGREIPVRHLTLGPITAEDTLELVQALASERAAAATEREASITFAQWLHRETAGQPFFISETLKELVERGVLGPHLSPENTWSLDIAQAGQWLAAQPSASLLPLGVRQLILARLNRLTANALALLTAVTVIGRDCSYTQMSQLAALPEEKGLPDLDELVRGRLLIETGDNGRTYTIAHDKIRDVVYSEAGAARRRVFHERAFFALQAAAAPPAELAHHALAAELGEPAFRYSLAAGDEAMRLFAVRDAIVHYEQARRMLDSASSPISNLRWNIDQSPISNLQLHHLYLQLGRAYELESDHTPATAAYQAMLTLAKESNRLEMECMALNRLARLAIHEYEFERARMLLEQAAEAAQKSGDKAGLAEVEWTQAQLAHHLFDFRLSRDHSRRALTLAREVGDQALVAGTLNSLAYAHLLDGDLNAGDAYMEEARSLYASLGNRALEADCLTALAALRIWLGQIEAGIAAARAAYTISQEIDNPWGQIYSSNWLAAGLVDQGAYEEALRIAQQSRRQAISHDFVPVTIFNLLVCGLVHRALRAFSAAQAIHLEARTLNQSKQSEHFAEMIAAELCADCALAGDWEGAAAYAREALALRKYKALPLVISPRWTETRALLQAGDDELAREDVRRWGALVGHIPRLRIPHLGSLALLAEWDNELAQAIIHLEAAYALAAEIVIPGEQWSILARLAQLYDASADGEQAQEKRRQAATIIHLLAKKIKDEQRRTLFLAATEIGR